MEDQGQSLGLGQDLEETETGAEPDTGAGTESGQDQGQRLKLGQD